MSPLADDAFPEMVHVVIAGAVVLVVLVPLLVYFGHRQRNAVMSYAKAQGWTYHDRDPGLAQRYLGRPFVADLAADAEAVIAGRYLGIPFAAYAYTYQTTTSTPQAAHATMTHTVPVVALLMETGLPDIDVQVEPESDLLEDFNAVFRVTVADREFADRLLTPDFRERLLSAPRHGWSWRSGDLLSLGSWNGKPEKIPVHLEHLSAVARHIPDELWGAYGTPRPLR